MLVFFYLIDWFGVIGECKFYIFMLCFGVMIVVGCCVNGLCVKVLDGIIIFNLLEVIECDFIFSEYFEIFIFKVV